VSEAPYALRIATGAARSLAEILNKNVLVRLNRELGADFAVDRVEHVAHWDPINEWIEMRRARNCSSKPASRVDCYRSYRSRVRVRVDPYDVWLGEGAFEGGELGADKRRRHEVIGAGEYPRPRRSLGYVEVQKDDAGAQIAKLIAMALPQ